MVSLASRPRMRHEWLVQVAGHLTDRDRQILDLVAVHRVFTTEQLCQMFFSNPTTARHRLTRLCQLRLLDRFAPYMVKGSAPYHYVLDELGAHVVAAHCDVDVKQVGWRRDKTLAVARSSRLAHLVGVNGFFAALIGVARRTPGTALLDWWSEAACTNWVGDLARPDGYGAWEHDGRVVAFFLEYDRHTEDLGRLTKKLDGYADLAVALDRRISVLFCFNSRRREASARRALADSPVPLATAVLRPGESPHKAVWLPPGSDGSGRYRLVDLTELP